MLSYEASVFDYRRLFIKRIIDIIGSLVGLAITLVTVGVGAAVSVHQVAKRWSGFNALARKAPYFSSLLIGLVGLYMGIHGYMGIVHTS